MHSLEPITPLAPAMCPVCGIEMTVFTDPATGRAVRTGGRAMMRCGRCGEVTVSHDAVRDRRRVRRYNAMATAAVTLGAGVMVVQELLHVYATNHAGPPPGWWVRACLLLFVPSAMFYFALRQVLIALDPREREHVIERWVAALLMAGLLGVTAWALVASLVKAAGAGRVVP